MRILEQLSEFSKQAKKKGHVGKLIGIDLPRRDLVVKEEYEKLELEIEKARQLSRKTNKEIKVDAGGVSGSAAEDYYVVTPDGRMDRCLGVIPGFGKFLINRSKLSFVEDEAPDRNAIFEAAFNGLWSPSATNWQPMRVVEVNTGMFKKLSGFKDVSLSDSGFGLVFLRRILYESLLVDVLEPFGLHVNAKEELIDWGIYSEVFKMSLESRGRSCLACDIVEREAPVVSELLLVEMSARLNKYRKALDSPKTSQGSAELIAKEIKKIEILSAELVSGRCYPAEALIIGKAVYDHGDSLCKDFNKVVLGRASERVASPNKKVPEGDIKKIIEYSMAGLTEEDRSRFRLACFDKDGEVPNKIGQGMFYALYGDGADLTTKKGGVNGCVLEMNIRNFMRVLLDKYPDEIEGLSVEMVNTMDSKDLKKFARTVPVKEKYIGVHILERIIRDGKYTLQKGVVINEKGKPLSAMLLVRIMANLAANFGNFFLKFQNTHPYTLILFARESKNLDEMSKTFMLLGRVVSIMTLHARSMGLTGIVKTGPIDVAREKIKEILIDYMLAHPEHKQFGNDLKTGLYQPAIFYQVGLPLAGDDIVDRGEPTEHSGFEERKRDKRPPREDSINHYIPILC